MLNPDLPKCASVEGDCPNGFFNNNDDQCVPEGGCPDGYHTVDDDETGRCIPDSDGCPEGMIFRSDGKTCGSQENVCEDNPELDACAETSCDPSYPDFCIEPNQSDLNCQDDDGILESNEIPHKNFKVGSDDPHGFDKDKDGIGCEEDEANESSSGSDILNCDDIPNSVKVTSSDPNRLDKDNDGIGCENNGKGGNGSGSDILNCDDIPNSVKVTSSDPNRLDKDNDGIGCENNGKGGNGSGSDILNCDDIPNSVKVTSSDPNRLDKDNDGIGCENNGKGGNGNNNGNNNNDDNDNDNGNNNDDDSNKYIITPSNSCTDISDTVDLSSEQIDPEDVRVIAFFDNCDLDSATLELNLVQNDDLKLVAANLNDGLSDAVEVEMNQVEQSESNSNILYEATITDNQEGPDLDTGETKTLNNVNGIVLWNDGEDEPIEFADNNFVEANINFFN